MGVAEDLEEKCQLFTFLIKMGGEGGCIFFLLVKMGDINNF